jgi:1-acyl-sn-glycerol-3-phosphate acyltransferase
MSQETLQPPRRLDQRFVAAIIARLLRLLFWYYGRWNVIGLENIPKTGAVLFAANHASYLDPLLGWVAVYGTRKMVGVAKEELWKNRIIAYLMDCLDSIPVKRHSADRVMFKRCLEVLERGDTLGIFPEGTRTYDGKLNPAEPGIALLYAKTKAPILPVALLGTYEMLPRKAKRLTRAKITVVIGKPLEITPQMNRNEIGEKVMVEIAALMTQHGTPMEPPSAERTALLPKEED